MGVVKTRLSFLGAGGVPARSNRRRFKPTCSVAAKKGQPIHRGAPPGKFRPGRSFSSPSKSVRGSAYQIRAPEDNSKLLHAPEFAVSRSFSIVWRRGERIRSALMFD